MSKETFTFIQAYNLQLKDLSEWSKLLNTESYMILLDEVIKRNHEGYSSPYDVCRGSDMSNIVQNMYKG